MEYRSSKIGWLLTIKFWFRQIPNCAGHQGKLPKHNSKVMPPPYWYNDQLIQQLHLQYHSINPNPHRSRNCQHLWLSPYNRTSKETFSNLQQGSPSPMTRPLFVSRTRSSATMFMLTIELYMLPATTATNRAVPTCPPPRSRHPLLQTNIYISNPQAQPYSCRTIVIDRQSAHANCLRSLTGLIMGGV